MIATVIIPSFVFFPSDHDINSNRFDFRYQNAKAIYRDRKPYVEHIDSSFLASPPRENDDKQANQYRLWKRRISYEKGNPEVGDLCSICGSLECSVVQCTIVE